MSALTFPAEFRNVQAHYPIVFHKTRDGQFQPLALFGFQDKQNLFLDADGLGCAVRAADDRAPAVPDRPSAIDELMVHIDLDSPRVSRTEGEPLFREHGGNTEFLERMSSVLLDDSSRAWRPCRPSSPRCCEHDLLESFVLDVELDDGSQHRLAGFYTINEERLARARRGGARTTAPGRATCRPIYMAIASLVALPRPDRARRTAAMLPDR